jgi:DNA-directed RNA polymerase specialized sigma24 family protein
VSDELYSMAQAAAILGISETSVSSLSRRARQAARRSGVGFTLRRSQKA